MNGVNVLSTHTIIAATSFDILMNTSLLGLDFGISAFRYALPMSRVKTVILSAAAIGTVV